MVQYGGSNRALLEVQGPKNRCYCISLQLRLYISGFSVILERFQTDPMLLRLGRVRAGARHKSSAIRVTARQPRVNPRQPRVNPRQPRVNPRQTRVNTAPTQSPPRIEKGAYLCELTARTPLERYRLRIGARVRRKTLELRRRANAALGAEILRSEQVLREGWFPNAGEVGRSRERQARSGSGGVSAAREDVKRGSVGSPYGTKYGGSVSNPEMPEFWFKSFDACVESTLVWTDNIGWARPLCSELWFYLLGKKKYGSMEADDQSAYRGMRGELSHPDGVLTGRSINRD
ncbi:hypothetical protein B0H15DRAFT_932633 [Mycena belliarum]|uniref:Uncharacterized protein n=1 Tax=Mycena belliarum TaxID=1033014 RepID=A0AAD6TX53_9AGAR|nr:hypothetical protein B0H15DRAFT_932633 [Mycena belliae]